MSALSPFGQSAHKSPDCENDAENHDGTQDEQDQAVFAKYVKKIRFLLHKVPSISGLGKV